VKPLVLIDLSNIAHAMFFSAMKETKIFHTSFTKFDYFQYLMYNRLKEFKLMNPNSEVVIAVDSGSWRKKVYPYYKGRRKLQRAKSKYDMNEMFLVLNDSIKALKEYFPFKTIQIHEAEADDIIGTLVCLFKNRKITIISRDRDFMQLQRFKKVKQFDPITREWIICDDPFHYLTSHIISGDAGDDITNILSDSDTFMTDGKRQRACGEKKIAKILDYGLEKFLDENPGTREKFTTNRKLVELSEECIPEDIQESIKFEYFNYKKPEGKSYKVLGDYFSTNSHLVPLSEKVLDFI
jgi:5'-3' exonuclease